MGTTAASLLSPAALAAVLCSSMSDMRDSECQNWDRHSFQHDNWHDKRLIEDSTLPLILYSYSQRSLIQKFKSYQN
jgi:hypothetical protein